MPVTIASTMEGIDVHPQSRQVDRPEVRRGHRRQRAAPARSARGHAQPARRRLRGRIHLVNPKRGDDRRPTRADVVARCRRRPTSRSSRRRPRPCPASSPSWARGAPRRWWSSPPASARAPTAARPSALRQAMLDAARPHLLRIVGPNCLGVMVPRPRPQRQLRPPRRPGRQARLRHPVGRHRSTARARLGRRPRHRLLAPRLAGRHGRRRFRRHARLPGAATPRPRAILLYVEAITARAQVHVGGARRARASSR